MKCPFRTITTADGNITRVDFADCIESECPFWGEEMTRFNECTMRREKLIIPICRRAKGEQE